MNKEDAFEITKPLGFDGLRHDPSNSTPNRRCPEWREKYDVIYMDIPDRFGESLILESVSELANEECAKHLLNAYIHRDVREAGHLLFKLLDQYRNIVATRETNEALS